MNKVIGGRFIYTIDGSMVEITWLSEHDPDGVYVCPVSTSGPDFYTSLKLLEVIA